VQQEEIERQASAEAEAPSTEDPPSEPVAEDPPSEPVAEDPPSEPVAGDPTLATLFSEMRSLNAELADAKAEARVAAARADAAEADVAALKPIACESVHRMQIAMGGQPTSLEGLPAATVVSQYTQVRKSFEEAFPTSAQSRAHAPARDESGATALQRGAALGIIPLKK